MSCPREKSLKNRETRSEHKFSVAKVESNSYSISIVMPAYNAEQFIADSICSVMGQTYDDWELIVINDGSTDGTRELVLTFIKQDARIRLIDNPANLGVTQTRKRGIEQARNSWIALLDSDDMWAPDKLSKQVDLARSIGAPALLFTGTTYVDKNGRKTSYCLTPPSKVDFKQLLVQNVVMCSSVLVHRDLLKFDDAIHDGMHEDYAMWLNILKEEPCAYAVSDPLNIYRISSGSKSSNKFRAALMNYRTLRYVGLGRFAALSNMIKYAANNLKKYIVIFKGFE